MQSMRKFNVFQLVDKDEMYCLTIVLKHLSGCKPLHFLNYRLSLKYECKAKRWLQAKALVNIIYTIMKSYLINAMLVKYSKSKEAMMMKKSSIKICALNVLINIVLIQFSPAILADVQPADYRHKLSDEVWEKNIRQQNFQDREIIEGTEQNILQLKAPVAAEDATVVPISIHTHIPQTPELYIKKISIFVDKNPMPVVGFFEFTPDSGKADLAMRIRVDTFSYVRAVAELNTGELYMTKRFVKAKGACSAPPPANMEDSKKFLGKMKMKIVGNVKMDKPNLVQVKILHPNITGMAPLRIGSRVIPPAFFMDTFAVEYNNKLIVKATLTFSISMDPAFRFYFVPEKNGVMTVRGTDTKKNAFSTNYDVKPS